MLQDIMRRVIHMQENLATVQERQGILIQAMQRVEEQLARWEQDQEEDDVAQDA